MRERFWSIVHDELQRSRLGVADTCDDVIKDQIETIILNVRVGGWIRPQLNVEDDFRRLLREMVQNAKQKGYSELHEDTYYDGRTNAGWICPGFWPFC